MFSPVSVVSLGFAMVAMFGVAIVDQPLPIVPVMPIVADSPAITAELEPWLDQVETMRIQAVDLAHQWEQTTPEAETDVFAEHVAGFVTLTENTSSNIRALESGNDAACILHGMALDIDHRLEALGEAVDGAAKSEVLNGINRLLFEGLLIFGREQEANAAPSNVIRVSTAPSEANPNPHPYVEVDCDGNPFEQE